MVKLSETPRLRAGADFQRWVAQFKACLVNDGGVDGLLDEMGNIRGPGDTVLASLEGRRAQENKLFAAIVGAAGREYKDETDNEVMLDVVLPFQGTADAGTMAWQKLCAHFSPRTLSVAMRQLMSYYSSRAGAEEEPVAYITGLNNLRAKIVANGGPMFMANSEFQRIAALLNGLDVYKEGAPEYRDRVSSPSPRLGGGCR